LQQFGIHPGGSHVLPEEVDINWVPEYVYDDKDKDKVMGVKIREEETNSVKLKAGVSICPGNLICS